MGEQDVDAPSSTGEPEPEVADAGAGVEYEEPPIRERDLEGGVCCPRSGWSRGPGWEPSRARPTL